MVIIDPKIISLIKKYFSQEKVKPRLYVASKHFNFYFAQGALWTESKSSVVYSRCTVAPARMYLYVIESYK